MPFPFLCLVDKTEMVIFNGKIIGEILKLTQSVHKCFQLELIFMFFVNA